MSKKKKQDSLPANNSPEKKSKGGISHRGWVVVMAGIALVIIGFIILSFTDARGQNWASVLSPFLLVGGYSLIGIGIVTPDPFM